MTLGYAVLFGLMWAGMVFYIEVTWASILNLTIPFSAFLISVPIAWMAVTLFILFAPEKTQYTVMIIGGALVALSALANIVCVLIKKLTQ